MHVIKGRRRSRAHLSALMAVVTLVVRSTSTHAATSSASFAGHRTGEL
jgi:hypothetical protein